MLTVKKLWSHPPHSHGTARSVGEIMASNRGDLAGKTLGTCILERLLGRGGMGEVYLARQTRPARNVAVKVLLPNLAPNSEVYQEFLARFRREADVIARLEHINIMPIYEYGEQDGLAYLVMPYLTGGSLRDTLAKRGPLPLQEVVKYSDQAAAALDYAHAHGVIHRDLKPANFLLHADGRLVLADFGIARIMDDTKAMGQTLTSTGMLIGTPEYMAPEMVRGEQIDYRADIYELGIVLYQVLSGRAPFTASTPLAIAIMHVQDVLPRLHPAYPVIPMAVDGVIQKATAKRREDRYTSASEMALALQQASTTPDSEYLENYGEHPTAVPPFPPTQQVILPPPPPAYSGSEVQQQVLPTGPSSYSARPQTPPTTAGSTPPPSHAHYQTPSGGSYPASPNRQQPWIIFVGILFALVLLVGGVIIGIQFSKGAARPNPTPDTTAIATMQTTPGATQTTTAAQSTPTAQATTTQPPSTPVVSPTTVPGSVPLGASLYAASSPGQNCDMNGGTWADFNKAKIDCQGNTTRITNTAPAAYLQGTFLTQIPGQTYPSDYVIQAQIQLDKNSPGKFGIYFRNQPGNQLGAYTLLIQPDGTWSANAYDNNTGTATKLATGSFGDAYASVTLAVVVKGQQFSFYANGKLFGTASDKSYASGTAGIAVDKGASITINKFALYATTA